MVKPKVVECENMESKTLNLDLMWNTAVSKVGGNSNTLDNFRVVAFQFFRMAKDEGVDYIVAEKYVMDTYDAVAPHFDRGC